ncbi:MAG TPA: DUF4432 family protein [Spirochaetales bacterium]|nr:DUF4432 family protein [Spirochaetales bacterium]
MAEYVGREWSKKELLSYVGDSHQLAGAQISTLNDGKAEGVKVININTGSGLNFSVLPGRGMDISHAFFKGKSLSFLSGTGITSPAYYEESGFKWLRSFFGGLLTTCGVSYSGAPSVDQKVFFHNLAADTENKTFMALLNRDIGDGTPLGIVIRFDKRKLPKFTEWKMTRQGFYALGLEPGTAVPLGRAAVREKGDLLFLQPQKRYIISIDFEVIESIPEMAAIESEALKLINDYDR